ncbi:hypothetical protein FA13DRAFT_1798441 [Coprinellus micaceus]|uniref:Uncharacterized protein n=1 Tax=Coprinellus micaceus TaxID=71717 RepID=A0A4Y7SMA2_COPMI|nr:hypothetical protein FA13DRAFT_1798441 [Coprinellus micaceus]
MLPIIEDLAAMTKGVEFKPPAILCASTVTGSLLPAGEAMDATHLLRHCLDPVRFSEAVSSLNSTLDNPGNTVCWVEVSPQRTMLPLLRTIIPNPNGTHIFVDSPLPGFDSWAALAEGLSRFTGRMCLFSGSKPSLVSADPDVSPFHDIPSGASHSTSHTVTPLRRADLPELLHLQVKNHGCLPPLRHLSHSFNDHQHETVERRYS